MPETTMQHRPPHILSASTNLLGICFVVIGGLKLSGSNHRSLADEAAWLAAVLLFVSALTAYLALRDESPNPLPARIADLTFLAGMTTLALSVVILVIWA
ncbi:MAG TPA: hypothetical protein VFS01_02405 [Rhizomicrobium sp.]|jgi:hypothetical protein|nr:hypothetical protein [Rhizomicrobium sp.]